MKKIVDKKVLEIYYKYDEDLGLLDESWADKSDREIVSYEQAIILGRYINDLHFLKSKRLSRKLRMKTLSELVELEMLIEDDVVSVLKEKILGKDLK